MKDKHIRYEREQYSHLVLLHCHHIAKNFWSISVAIVVSTLIVMVVTGHVYQFVRKRTKHHHENENI